MGRAAPALVVLTTVRKQAEQGSREHSSMASALAPALTFCNNGLYCKTVRRNECCSSPVALVMGLHHNNGNPKTLLYHTSAFYESYVFSIIFRISIYFACSLVWRLSVSPTQNEDQRKDDLLSSQLIHS